MAKNQYSAVIADDHAVVRSALRTILENMGDVTVVAEAANGIEAVALARAHGPDLLTLDSGMPSMSGIEALTELRKWAPDSRICVVTGFTATAGLAAWVNAGVEGLFLKDAASDELARGFRAILEGNRAIASAVTERLQPDNATVLTPREHLVLCMVSEGLSNGAIARRLSISPKTVDNHRTRMMSKLGAHSVGELVAHALREGLLDPSAQF